LGKINLEAFGLKNGSLESPDKYIPEIIEVAKQLVVLKDEYYVMDSMREDIIKLEEYYNKNESSEKNQKFFQLISQPESETLEFKLNIRDPRLIRKNLTSIANTKGGYLVIGIADDKKDIKEKIVGIHNPEKKIELINKIAENIYPPVDLIYEIIEIGKKKVLIIEIGYDDKFIHFVNGIGYHRIGHTEYAYNAEQLKNQILSKTEKSFEKYSEQIDVLTQTIEKLKPPNYGTITHLEETLTHNIYDFVLKNPTIWKKNTRGITPQRKKLIKKQDKFRCQSCGELFKEEDLVIDHIFPYSLGGSNEVYNLMSLCKEHNDDKSASLEYYRSEEGRYKICDNIKKFVRSLPIIFNFEEWLKKYGDARRRVKKV